MFPGSVHLRHLGSPPESPGIFWDRLGPRFQFLAEKRQWFCQDPSAEGNWEDWSRRSRSAELWAPGSWDPKKNNFSADSVDKTMEDNMKSEDQSDKWEWKNMEKRMKWT